MGQIKNIKLHIVTDIKATTDQKHLCHVVSPWHLMAKVWGVSLDCLVGVVIRNPSLLTCRRTQRSLVVNTRPLFNPSSPRRRASAYGRRFTFLLLQRMCRSLSRR